MKREKLETYLGKNVTVTVFDGDITTGILKRGDGYERNYYACGIVSRGNGFWFRSSHVVKIKEATNEHAEN